MREYRWLQAEKFSLQRARLFETNNLENKERRERMGNRGGEGQIESAASLYSRRSFNHSVEIEDRK